MNDDNPNAPKESADDRRCHPDIPMDLDALRELSNQIVRAVTSPEMVRQVLAVLGAESGRKYTEAATRLTPSGLRQAGVPLPNSTRISSRYFEEGLRDEVVFTDIAGSRDILQILNAGQPGILDLIAKEQPEILDRFKLPGTGPLADPYNKLRPPRPIDPNPFAATGLCVCVGGGGPGFSACVGVGA
ncbi:hypothetical protein ACWFRF_28880 [Nocardia sp. NPDC055165]